MDEALLRVASLKKTFPLPRKMRAASSSGRLIAVDDLSFNVHKGEIYGLLGPNGAGKSTTLKMIASLLKPDSGDISIMGHDLLKEQEKARVKVGYLTCDLKLDGFFTPDYTFSFFGSLYGLDEETISKRKEILFKDFGINDFRDQKINKLSTGMAQKVSLAISLLHDPELIVYDEPTNGLDILAAKAVEDYLLEQKKKDKAIIISTHIMSLVEKIADRVGIIIEGKLIHEGDIASIKESGGLEKLFFDLAKEHGSLHS